MALTDTQKALVRMYLGYSDASRGGGGTDLERAMDGLSAGAETLVGTALTSLESLESKLAGSWDRQSTLVAEDVTLAGEGELRALRGEGRRLVRRLSVLCGVEVLNDIFGAGSGGGPCGRG